MRPPMRLLPALLVVAIAGCGGSPKRAAGPSLAAGTPVRITDGQQIYDALNTTDCVKWPSPDVKKRAGRDAWGSFLPDAGLEGKVLAALAHCDGKTQVVLVEAGDWVIPVTRRGVEVVKLAEALAKAPPGVLKEIEDPKAFEDVLGGEDVGWDEAWLDEGVEGGVVGGVVGGFGGDVDGMDGPLYYPGDLVEIVDAGQRYPWASAKDCFAWPSKDVEKRAAKDYTPKDGQQGTVLATTPHCHDAALEVLILDVDGHVVTIHPGGVILY